MQIDPRNPLPVNQLNRTGRPVGPGRADAHGRESAPKRGGLELSDRARLAQAAREALAAGVALPAGRQERLEQLRKAIETGEYAAPSETVAGHMWQSGALRW